MISRCRALVFPGEEDFGMVAVEAMASRRPIVAFGCGGATEMLADGVSGVFAEQTVEAISAGVRRLAGLDIDPCEDRGPCRPLRPRAVL